MVAPRSSSPWPHRLDLERLAVFAVKLAPLEDHARRLYLGRSVVLVARKDQLFAFLLVADAVGDRGALHGGRQLGDEIAHLVGVRHQHHFWLPGSDELFQRSGKGVWCVRFELR